MSRSVVLRDGAARDIADAFAYLASHGRGDAFMAAVDHTLSKIGERPMMYPEIGDGVRRALLRRFAYSVFFVLEDDQAVVLAVHHHRRDPASRPRR